MNVAEPSSEVPATGDRVEEASPAMLSQSQGIGVAGLRTSALGSRSLPSQPQSPSLVSSTPLPLQQSGPLPASVPLEQSMEMFQYNFSNQEMLQHNSSNQEMHQYNSNDQELFHSNPNRLYKTPLQALFRYQDLFSNRLHRSLLHNSRLYPCQAHNYQFKMIQISLQFALL